MTYIFLNHVIIQLTKLILEKSADCDDGCEGNAQGLGQHDRD